MTRADLEAAAEEKYPSDTANPLRGLNEARRAAYIRGRLDQAEADAQIAEAEGHNWSGYPAHAFFAIAAEIRKGVQ